MWVDYEIRGVVRGLADSDGSIQYLSGSPKRLFINTTSALTVFQLLRHIYDAYGYVVRVSIDRYLRSAREEFLRIEFRRRIARSNLRSKAAVLLRIVIHKRDLVSKFLSLGNLNSYFTGLIAGDWYLKPRVKVKKKHIVLSLRNIEIHQVDKTFLLRLKKLLDSINVNRSGVHVHSRKGKHVIYALSINPRELISKIYSYKPNYRWRLMDLYCDKASILDVIYFVYVDRYLLRHALGHIMYGTSILEEHEVEFLHKHLFNKRLDITYKEFVARKNLYSAREYTRQTI